MQQVLFRVFGFPLYGFAAMLFLAFVFCTWLAGRRAEQEGIRKEHIQDLALWIFVPGIIGARLFFLSDRGEPLYNFYRIWEGGLVFYGSAIGGVVGYGLAYFWNIRKQGFSTWQMADIIAPSVALGLCLGRIGCFLNGCCYGAIATCPDCPAAHFPILSFLGRTEIVGHGFQTAAGFTVRDQRRNSTEDLQEMALVIVDAVEAGSPAAQAGLKSGDQIIEVDNKEVGSLRDLDYFILREGELGRKDLTLTVERHGKKEKLEPFQPRTLGLHPTQLYESVSMLLLLGLLLTYYPFRRHTGELTGILMFCYGIHRYLDELLRADPRPEGPEKYISLFLVGAGLAVWVWRRWFVWEIKKEPTPIPAKVA
jgi:phosphatidylglycerol:prolipoprotein diacylglycerol transferase